MLASKRTVLHGCVCALGAVTLACGDATTATAPATQDLLASPSSVTASAVSLTGRIVYVNKGLRVYNLATSTDVSLARSGVNPDFSPDGARVTYQDGGIRVMNSDGSNVRVLSTSGANPSFNATGTEIAFVNSGVWKINVDGTGLTRLTADDAHWPDWSPDGTQIAYGAPGANGSSQLFIVNADGSNRHQALTSGAIIDVAWQPSSRLLFGIAGGKPISYELYSYDPGSPSSLTRLFARGFEPSWSPDATQISWAGTGGIWIMNADGSGKQGPVIAKGRQGSWGR